MTKVCCTCRRSLPLKEFHNEKKSKDGKQAQCNTCKREYILKWRHEVELQQPMSENKKCTAFLGVYVAETALAGVFSNVVRNAYGKPGYDFICGNGFKIDVKSSCKILRGANKGGWTFTIKRNKIANYFACLAFDDRISLTPMHFWLIPGDAVNSRLGILIYPSTLHKWNKYEKPLDKILCSCDSIRNQRAGLI